MEHYRLLYKANRSVLSPKNNKRKVAHEIRATKRSEMYSSTRNISLSPSPSRQGNPADEQKENFKPPPPVAPLELADVPERVSETNSNQPSSKIAEKQSRQKAYLIKFLAWKTEKMQTQQKSKRPPFVVPTGKFTAAVEPKNLRKTFAPKNHVFNPPANLKDLKVEVVGANSIRCVNGEQQATYHFVETPKKKCASVKPAPPKTIQVSKPLVPRPAGHKTPLPVTKTEIKPSTTATISSKKVPPVVSKPKPIVAGNIKAPPASKSAHISSARPVRAPIRPQTQQLAPKSTRKPPNIVPSNTKMPPPSQQAPKITRKAQTSTTNASSKTKSGLPAIKRPTFKASKKVNSSISNAVHAMKGNSKLKTSAVPPTFKLNGKSFLQCIAEPTKFTDPVPETPTDLNPTNLYLNFVTSTKRKSSSGKDSNADLLFAELGNTISPVDDCRLTPAEQKSKMKDDNKFQFVRYWSLEEDKEAANKPEEAEKPVETEKPTEVEKSTEAVKPTEEIKSTPDKNGASPTTYMSPYVSVSRGKVSSKIEREKRNSIYLASENHTSTGTPEATATGRRTLATVHYYRKQLADEIDRLNEQCNSWEQYKEANGKLIDDGGVDMISVTIGQTKLLVTKKLKQFSGLIDRCENGALGKCTTRYGDSEAVKPILAEDLEGFWSMVGLQIDNVDKRFADLERWKANNWTDPDEIPTKAVKAQGAVKKMKKRKPITTARSNDTLQKMLKTAHAAFLKKKANGDADEDVILTPSKSRQVLIKDRRSRSAAATVITVNTPRTTRKSSLDETPKIRPHLNNFRKSLNLLQTTLIGEHERKSTVEDYVSPLRNQSISRKSILKTPGSRSRPKSIVWNSPILKFTMTEDTVDGARNTSHEDQEEDKRTYKLRNRNIILRDSAEFVIPK